MNRSDRIRSISTLFDDITSGASDVFILFADLVASSEYKRRLFEAQEPDVYWISRQLIFLQRAAEIVESYDGTIVKTIGDEIMAMFRYDSVPSQVLKAGIEIVQGFENLKFYTGRSAIHAKISIDFGTTYDGRIVDGLPYDPVGSCVDRAARLEGAAKRDEIVVSQDFIDRLRDEYGSPFSAESQGFLPEETEKLKGFLKQTIYRLPAGKKAST